MVLFLFCIDLPFFHISLCLCSTSFTFSFEHIVFFSQVNKMLSIANPTTPPFQKVCENCHVIDITISPIGGVYCIDCQSTVQKLGCFCGSIATNDEPVLLTIEGKWLETIVHMTEFEFLDLLSLKQVQLLISICIHIKFCLSTNLPLLAFKKTSNNLSHKWKPI